MPNSKNFKALKKRLNELRKTMLPLKFSPIGSYTDKEQDLARGYLLLAHAEIESYLEDICKGLVFDSIKHWKANKKPSSVLLSTLASYHSGWNVEDDTNHQEIINFARSRFKVGTAVGDVIDAASRQYGAQVSSNNGLKKTNLKNLLLPTGICLDDLDNTWLVNMENFGSLRGESAHSSKYTTTKLINPQDELIRINGLLSGLKDLDSKMLKIREELK